MPSLRGRPERILPADVNFIIMNGRIGTNCHFSSCVGVFSADVVGIIRVVLLKRVNRKYY